MCRAIAARAYASVPALAQSAPAPDPCFDSAGFRDRAPYRIGCGMDAMQGRCDRAGYGRWRALVLVLAIGGCGAPPPPLTETWGALPAPEGAYVLSTASAQVDPAVLAEVGQCLAEVGLKAGGPPHLLVDLAYGVAPARVAVTGAGHQEPQPAVTDGRLSSHGTPVETLTLVITDMAGNRDVFRAQLARHQPGPRARTTLAATLCQSLKQAQASPANPA